MNRLSCRDRSSGRSLSQVGALLGMLVCSTGLVHCWPTFPDDQLKPVSDAGDTGVIDTGRDVPSDIIPVDTTSPFIRGGWNACSTPPPAVGSLTYFSSAPGNPRDITFHPQKLLIGAQSGFYEFDSMGMTVIPDPDASVPAPIPGIRVLRYRNPTTLAVAQNYNDGTTAYSGISLVNDTGLATRLTASGTDVRGMAVTRSGGIFYTDASNRSVNFRNDILGASTVVYTFAMQIPETLALSPDERLLYVSTAGRMVFEIPLDAVGALAGAVTPYIADVPIINAMAFDSCGNLYLAHDDRVRRVRAGTRAIENVIVTTVLDPDSGTNNVVRPLALAFGPNATFGTTNLYMLDVNSVAVYRVDVGIAGQPIP